jgi:hypothetical protein
MGTAAAGAGFLAADEKFIRRHASGQHSPIVADGAPSELLQTVPGGFAAAVTHTLLKVDGRAPVFRVVKHLKALNWQVIGLLNLSMMVPAARKCRCTGSLNSAGTWYHRIFCRRNHRVTFA